MTNSWMNADGEPIMSGDAWRFEQELDRQSAEERYAEDFYDNEGSFDDDLCESCGQSDWTEEVNGRYLCDGCIEALNADDDFASDEREYFPEDAHLDGTWEA